MEPLNIGQEYIFFLDENNIFLSPFTVITISDGKVKVSARMCPESLLDENGKVPEQGISVDAYMKAVEKTFWYVMVIKVLVHVAVIGLVLLICYLVCRNLYKTMKYIFQSR